jgi:hypothetical protein
MARRRAVIAAGIGAAVLIGAAAALLSFDAAALGRAVLARAATATGVKLTARDVRLRLLSGLTLDGVEGTAAFSGGRAALSLDRLVLDHRLWPLLRGQLAVDRLVLRRPHLRLAETRTDARAPVAAAAVAPLGPLGLQVSRIDVEEGTIELLALGESAPMVMRGFDLRLREVALEGGGPALTALRGMGELRIAEVAFPRTRVSGVNGPVRLAGGRLTAGPIHFTTPQGPFEATLEARLERLPFTYTLALRGEPLDLATLMAASAKTAATGTAALRLDAKGVGSESTGLAGRGTLRLGGGQLPSTPLLRAVEQAIGRTRIVGARYQPADATFRLEKGRVLLDPLRLRAESVGLDVAGWASLQGPLDLTLAVHAPRDGVTVSGVAGGALDLITDEDGRVVIPLRVTGTQDDPRVRPDAASLADTARRGATRRLLDKAGQGLSGLFRKREPPP